MILNYGVVKNSKSVMNKKEIKKSNFTKSETNTSKKPWQKC